MAMLAILVLGASWWLVSAVQNPVNRTALERAQNARVLAEAKQAVLGWVAQNAADTTDWNPGKLPCPEALGNFQVPPAAGEGVLQGFCAGAATAVGRLPWKSLGIDKPYDASGEVLWYVVSPGWKRDNSTSPEPALGINSNAKGQLTVDGVANAAVAAIVAPGRKLAINPIASQSAQGCTATTQSRTTFPPVDSTHYLDCQSIGAASLRTAVADNATHEVFNDQVVLITAKEVMDAIEGAVAARLAASVAPQLDMIYNSATWGVSATTPIYPYPARFANDAGTAFSPESYKGRRFSNDADTTGSVTQGLLPMTAQTCNTMTTGRCDGTFVQWTLGTFSASQTGGTATTFSADCTSSNATQIRCVINYSQLLCLVWCDINATVSVRGDARNVGKTMKTLNASGATATPTAPSTAGAFTASATLLADTAASARATWTVTLNGGSAGICGFLIAVLCSGSAVITIPVSPGFQDHAFVNPATTDAWYWFTANKWHEVTYYAVAPSHLPSAGTHDCRLAPPPSPPTLNGESGDCLTILGGSFPPNLRGILVFAGRSLANASRPNGNLSDLLENVTGYTAPAPNRDGDGDFVKGTFHRTYNDRFASTGNYP